MLASQGDISSPALLLLLLGLSGVIASGCVFNNYFDRHIDQKMARTGKRALVTGTISPRNALIFGTILGVLGVIALAYTHWLAAVIAVLGWVAYVIIYGIAKRASIYGTLVGSISGATPPVIGYTAFTGQFDTTAAVLFIILVCWQMPHFYAIAIFRRSDYMAATIPVWPAVKSMRSTKVQIVGYSIAFAVAVSLLPLIGAVGTTYTVIMLALGLLWVGVAVKGFWVSQNERWARSVFGLSLIILLIFSGLLATESFLP